MNSGFGFQQLIELCQRTHQEMQSRAGHSVDTFLVVRNWLFGWYIVEYEQNGADRAEYGRGFLVTLSKRLQEIGIRGSSPTRLKLYRAFYRQHRRIGPTVSDQSGDKPDRIVDKALVVFVTKMLNALFEAFLLILVAAYYHIWLYPFHFAHIPVYRTLLTNSSVLS